MRNNSRWLMAALLGGFFLSGVPVQARDVTLTPDQLVGLTITLPVAGEFQVGVTATGPGGSTTSEITITVVQPAPLPTLTVQDVEGAVGEPIPLVIGTDADSVTLTIPDEAMLSVEGTPPGAVSYFDVDARRIFLAQTSDPALVALMADRTTPWAPPAPQTINIPPFFLADGTRNPDWSGAMDPLLKFHDAVNNLARMYVITGDLVHAEALLGILDAWAVAGSMAETENKQAWYQVTWAITDAGLTYSLVRDALPQSAAKTRAEAWLNNTTQTVIDKPGSVAAGGFGGDADNNISYWRGLAAASVGVVSDDAEMYAWGTAKVLRALTDMNADGSLPHEMVRGKRALHYQHFAMKALILIAQVAAQRGDDLYALDVGGRSLHTAVEFTLRATDDPSLVEVHAGVPQEFSAANGLSWAEVYYRSFPRPDMVQYLGLETLPAGRLAIVPLSTLYFYMPEG